MRALELVDRHELDQGMRVLELEDQLETQRELASRWRRSFEGLSAIVAMNPDDRLKRLEELAREWVSKA